MRMSRRRTAIMAASAVIVLVGGLTVTSAAPQATAATSWATAATSRVTSATPQAAVVEPDATVAAATAAHVGSPPTSSHCQPSDATAPPTSANAVAAAGEVTIWMAGDSTMMNASTCPIGWGSQFGAYFDSNVTVVNNAVGGRSIQTWLYDPNVTTTKGSNGECVISPQTYATRWQSTLDGMKAGDYLFVQFGINDGSSTCNRHVGSARYRELLAMMAKAAQQRGAHPIFLTPVAAITCSNGSAVGNRGFLTETFEVGAAINVPVIDLHKLSYTRYNTLKLCPNTGDYTSGAVGAFFCNDHTHFEAAGAKQIAGVVAKALRDQGIDLAAHLV